MSVADARGRRFDALTGIGFAVLAIVGFAMPGTPLKADASDAKMLSFFSDHRQDLLVGSLVLGLAAVFFLWFLGSLRSYLRAGEGGEGRLSIAAFGGGAAAMVLILVGAGLANAPAFTLARHGGGSPDVVRAFFDASSAMFLLSGLAIAVFFAAASCSAARSGSLPAWAYWWGSVTALLQVIAAVGLFAKSGAFATGGEFGLIAALSGLLWTAAVAVVIMRRDGVPPRPLAEP
jgi:hypothetical protein